MGISVQTTWRRTGRRGSVMERIKDKREGRYHINRVRDRGIDVYIDRDESTDCELKREKDRERKRGRGGETQSFLCLSKIDTSRTGWLSCQPLHTYTHTHIYIYVHIFIHTHTQTYIHTQHAIIIDDREIKQKGHFVCVSCCLKRVGTILRTLDRYQ